MSHTRIQKLVAVRDEFLAAQAGLRYAIENWPFAGDAMPSQSRDLRHFRGAASNLEATYIIRLFIQFEEELKQRLTEGNRRVPYTAERLINKVALLEHISNDVRDGAHTVRTYRNDLVHSSFTVAVPIQFTNALAALNTFLSWLPEPP